MSDDNIWSDAWGEQGEDWSGGGAKDKRLPRAPERPGVGATLYELGPGNFVVYHFHHAWEELLIVLRGRPTLRTPDGERRLEQGETVFFPLGPVGAHSLRNDTDEPVRYVMASTLSAPEVVVPRTSQGEDIAYATFRDPAGNVLGIFQEGS